MSARLTLAFEEPHFARLGGLLFGWVLDLL
jgi:hypothetical protein